MSLHHLCYNYCISHLIGAMLLVNIKVIVNTGVYSNFNYIFMQYGNVISCKLHTLYTPQGGKISWLYINPTCSLAKTIPSGVDYLWYISRFLTFQLRASGTNNRPVIGAFFVSIFGSGFHFQFPFPVFHYLLFHNNYTPRYS